MKQYDVVMSAPYCCVAANIESILKRHGIYNISQYDIANEFGIVALISEMEELPAELTNVTYTDDVKQVGMHLTNDSLNDFFVKHNLPFHETYIGWRSISEINIDSMLQAVNEDYDVIFYFDFGDLYNEERNRGVGHSSVFISLDESYIITHLNPGPRFLGLNKHGSEDIAHAIRSRAGGISIIYSKK